MVTHAERSRYYGQVDSFEWPDHALLIKYVMHHDELTDDERERFQAMAEGLGLKVI
jgi:hypothetical protein